MNLLLQFLVGSTVKGGEVEEASQLHGHLLTLPQSPLHALTGG